MHFLPQNIVWLVGIKLTFSVPIADCVAFSDLTHSVITALLLEWSATSLEGCMCGCIGLLSPSHKMIPDSYSKREGATPGILVSCLNNR